MPVSSKPSNAALGNSFVLLYYNTQEKEEKNLKYFITIKYVLMQLELK